MVGRHRQRHCSGGCCWREEAFISIFVDCIQFVLSNTIHRINGQQIKEEEDKKNGNISIQANNTNCLACMRWDFHLCVATFRFLVPYTFPLTFCVCKRACVIMFFGFFLFLFLLCVVVVAAVQRRQVTISY